MHGFTRGIIIEALKSPAESGREPGEVVKYEAIGHDMPEEVSVFAKEPAGVETFGEDLSPPVAAAVEWALDLVCGEVGV